MATASESRLGIIRITNIHAKHRRLCCRNPNGVGQLDPSYTELQIFVSRVINKEKSVLLLSPARRLLLAHWPYTRLYLPSRILCFCVEASDGASANRGIPQAPPSLPSPPSPAFPGQPPRPAPAHYETLGDAMDRGDACAMGPASPSPRRGRSRGTGAAGGPVQRERRRLHPLPHRDFRGTDHGRPRRRLCDVSGVAGAPADLEEREMTVQATNSVIEAAASTECTTRKESNQRSARHGRRRQNEGD